MTHYWVIHLRTYKRWWHTFVGAGWVSFKERQLGSDTARVQRAVPRQRCAGFSRNGRIATGTTFSCGCFVGKEKSLISAVASHSVTMCSWKPSPRLPSLSPRPPPALSPPFLPLSISTWHLQSISASFLPRAVWRATGRRKPARPAHKPARYPIMAKDGPLCSQWRCSCQRVG